MLWVCRAGRKACYYEKDIIERRIYLPWKGYDYDLSKNYELPDFKQLVSIEENTTNPTSISNWAGQLQYFVKQMNIDDYVIIPSERSKSYTLAMIISDYKYSKSSELHHFRETVIIKSNIDRSIFNQSEIYSLGAYRTIFHPRKEEDILQKIL